MTILDQMIREAPRPSAWEDALVGLIIAAATFELGVVFALPARLRELAVGHGGPLADATVLLGVATLLGGLAWALHRVRRLSRELAACRDPACARPPSWSAAVPPDGAGPTTA
jgi:hypothetical protein